jgi:hypothetical protein
VPALELQRAPAVAARPSVGIEVGVAGSGRLALAPLYAFAGGLVYAGVRAAGWLLALDVQWDAEQLLTRNATPTFELEAVGAGIFVTKRLWGSRFAEFELGPAAKVVGQSESIKGLGASSHTDSTTDTRLGGIARMLFGRGALRYLVSLDSDVSPLRLVRPRRLEPALPRLPVWSLGLSFAVCWREI